ncbi:hypothetical protein DM02DRAFT_162342 [Periconia macrospinosa]|uniref:Uncharacterized protein n=1 Tax=Periconia macrospinosa TaxID=97972 RepID=A0A2V1E516_9PLEO|nr:hypothetical protein DM02DRAFT_162342 [Periconia macrospinosa]
MTSRETRPGRPPSDEEIYMSLSEVRTIREPLYNPALCINLSLRFATKNQRCSRAHLPEKAHLASIYPGYSNLIVRSQQTAGPNGHLNYVALVLYAPSLSLGPFFRSITSSPILLLYHYLYNSATPVQSPNRSCPDPQFSWTQTVVYFLSEANIRGVGKTDTRLRNPRASQPLRQLSTMMLRSITTIDC